MHPDDRYGASRAHMATARTLIPGGVSSAPRVNQRPTPICVARAAGSRVEDVDGNVYIDYLGAYGPLILGHAPVPVLDAVRAALDDGVLYGMQHRREIRAAELVVTAVPSVEMVAFFCSGSEAVNAALGVARGVTGRRRILKFEGHYHGWIDPIGVSQPGVAPGAGAPPYRPVAVPGWSDTGTVLIAPWNDAVALRAVFAAHGDEIAAVIMEPVVCNGGTLTPDPGYLDAVRQVCDAHGALVVFDEVITGFRMAPGGAQECLGFAPDLTVMAKAMASGFPLAAVGGTAAVMTHALDHGVALRGTYNGNPVVLAAAEATMGTLLDGRDVLYPRLERHGRALADGVASAAAEAGAPVCCNQVGSVLSLFWGLDRAPTDYREVARNDRAALQVLEAQLTDHGILTLPGGRMYVSAAHSDDDIAATVAALPAALRGTVRALAARAR